jgi:hypothetical protein
MAIMGLPQALKLIEGPIDALASLSQTQLMAMAQRNPSVLKVLPIVLNEKAEAAQRAANMAALAQGTPPSVTEQNMAVNAQAEAQPMMQMQQPSMMAAPQQMAPMDAGVASLPVPEGTYATGGIVAFEEGGQAKSGNATDAIEQLYTRELARASDPEGYRFWSEKFGPEVSADERALFIAEAAPEVQRRIAAGDTNLPEYMRVDPAARRALQSKDVTTEDFKTLANYFGNQWIGGEAEDPASLTRRDYIERPRTGYDFATFLASRSQQHGAQPDTKQRLSNLMAPFMDVDTSETPAEMRYIGGEGNEFGYVVTNPLTGEREMAYPSGALGPTQEGRYRTSYGVHHSSIGDPDRTRYAVGLDYLVDPKTGRARLVEPYLEGYQERKRDNSIPIKALATLAGAYAFPGAIGQGIDFGDMLKRGLVSLGGEAVSRMAKGGEVPRYQNQGLVDLVSSQQGSDPYSQYYGFGPTAGLSDYVRQYQSLTAPLRELSEEEKTAMAIRGRSPEEIRQQKYMRILEAGLGILGGTSPYALTNIGQGSQAALKGYAEDIRERRKEDLALTQAKAEMARRRREEQLADVTGGMGLFKEAQAENRAKLDRDIREREVDLRSKQLDLPPDIIRSAKAIQLPGESLSDALERYSKIVAKEPDRFNSISNRVGKAYELWVNSDEYRTAKKAITEAKGDPNDTNSPKAKAIEAFNNARTKFYEAANISAGDLAYLASVNAAYSPNPNSSSTLPSGLPPGSKQIGTSNGKPVYQKPNGERVILQ